MSQFKKFGRIFGLMFVTASAAAFLLYFGLKVLSGRSPVQMFMPFAPVHAVPYHTRYPVPYLLAIAFVFALVSALWLVFIAPRFTRFRFLQSVVLPWLTVLFAGPVWGMLWVFHDMQAGFFPPFPEMIDYLLFGARQGVFFALNAVLFSVPLNLLAYGAACLLLMLLARRFGIERPERVPLGNS